VNLQPFNKSAGKPPMGSLAVRASRSCVEIGPQSGKVIVRLGVATERLNRICSDETSSGSVGLREMRSEAKSNGDPHPHSFVRLAQPHARASTVLGDKLNSSGFHCDAHFVHAAYSCVLARLEAIDCIAAYVRFTREIEGAPSKRCSAHSTLSWGHMVKLSPVAVDSKW
jgi:hypothetical protein